jgi:hypothetical protein
MRPARSAHVTPDLLYEVNGAGDVGVDHPHDIAEILVEKAFSQAAAGVGEERVDRPSHSFGNSVELVDTLQSGEICLYCLDCRAQVAKVSRGVFDLRLVGGDHQIETILGADLGEFVANSGGGAGDKGEGTGSLSHFQSPIRLELMQSRTGETVCSSSSTAEGEFRRIKSSNG